MTPFRVLLFGLIALAALLAVLNPGPERFQEFLGEEIARRTAETSGAVAGPLGEGVAGFLADRLGRAVSGPASQAFERDNYYVASVYRLDINGRMPDGEVEFLGIANRFFPMKVPAVLRGE